MNLTEKQKEIVETDARFVVVNASAASGKTATLTERVKYLLNKNINPEEIVVITFTNAAADEMKERIRETKGAFIGTIHSYANYLLKSCGYETESYLSEEDFDQLFEEVKNHQECIKTVEHLLLDEGQDTTAQQFQFLLDMILPKNWMIFSDHKQSIYRWNGADPKYILNLMNENWVKVYDLNENYRNGANILNFAKSIIRLNGIDYRDNSVSMYEKRGRVIDVECSYPNLASGIKKKGEYGDWFVLTRTNQQVNEMCEQLQQLGIPYTAFKKKGLSQKEIRDKLNNDTVKVMTIHMSKGLETKYVIVIGAKFFSLEEKCIGYVAATRAKELLVWAREPKKRRKQQQENFEIWE